MLDYEKERKKLVNKHSANTKKWNKENPDKRISGVMPEDYTLPTEYKRSVTSSSQKENKTGGTLKTGSNAVSSVAKQTLDTAKSQPVRRNSQVDTGTGKYRTDNAKNYTKMKSQNKGSSRRGSGYQSSKAGERIGNVVKGTGKQLGASYLNAMATPNANAKISEAKVKAEGSWGVTEKQKGKSNAKKYDSVFYKTAAQAETEKKASEKLKTQTSQMQKSYAEGVKKVQAQASALRQSGSEDVEKAKEGLGKVGQFGVDMASQLMMWGSDAAIGAATGTGMLTPMFVRSFGDASMTAREAGATQGQQVFAGVAAGSIEAATEKLFSPYKVFKRTAGAGIADNLAEKASYKIADKIASKLVKSGVPSNAMYKALRTTIKGASGMAEEGAEEVLSDLAQPLYERVYDKDSLKQYGTSEYWKNTARDFGMGAAMAGVLGGGHTMMSKAKNKVTGQSQKQAQPYTEEEKAQTIQVAKAQGEDSNAYKFAQTLEQQQAGGKEILDAQVDDLTRMVVEEQMEAERTMSEQQEAEERKQFQMVQQKAGETEGYLPQSGKLTTVEARHVNEVVALRVDTNARRIEQNLVNVFHADPQTAYAQAESIARIKTGTATASDLSVAAVTNIPARAAIMRELGIKLPATNEGTMKTLTEYEGVTRAVQKQNILKQARQSARAELFETFTMGMDDTTADIFAEGMEKVQIADMPKYMEAFATYYEGGRVNYDYDRIPIAKAYKGYIPADIKLAAYNAGNQIYQAEQAQAAVNQVEVVKGERTSGTLELSEQNAKKLGKEQTAALRMMTEVTGKHVVVLDQIDAGSRKDVANGKYQDGVIYISAKSQAPVFDVLKHELTHNLQETAPEAYNELKQYVFKKFYEADRQKYENTLRNMIERYAAGGVELTRSQAEDELLADATDAFFRDYNAIQDLVMENRSLGEKLLDGIRSLLDTFHRLATGSQSEEKGSLKGEWLEAIGALEEAERLWVKALNESIGVKSGKSGGKFQLKSPVEETKDLLAMHNLTEQKLMSTLRLEGFPMPSIAVTNQEHTNFGEITVLFGKETIDPKNRKNKVYSADAWTPTVPSVEYETDSKIERKAYSDITGLIDNEHYRNEAARYLNEVEYYLNHYGGYDGWIDLVAEKPGIQYAYLKSLGEDIEIPMKEKKVNPGFNENSIEQYDYLIEHYDGDIHELLKIPMKELMASDLMKSYAEKFGYNLNSPMARRVLPKQVVQAAAYADYDADAIQKEYEPDYSAANKVMAERVDQYALKAWLRQQTEGIVSGEGIYNGKGYLNERTGERRSFKATHYPVTAANIVRAMQAQGEKNVSGFNGIKTLRANTAKSFKSIAEIKENKPRLQNLTVEEFEKINEELSDKMYGVFDEILSQNEWMASGISFPADVIGNILSEAVEDGLTGETQLSEHYARYGWNIDTRTAEGLSELLDAISVMPVSMFEAKPQRVVGFDEIKAVILPSDSSQELKDALNEREVNSIEYDGTEEDRLEKVNNAADSTQARFQLKSNDIREFDMTKEKVLANMKAVTEMEPVAELSSSEFEKGQTDLITQVTDFFNSIGNVAHNDVLGDVKLNRKGVKSSIAHGIGRLKAIAFRSVPDVIGHGEIIDAQYNWKSRGYNTVVIAAPIQIGGDAYYVAAVIERDLSGKSQTYYLHEVSAIKKNSAPFKTAASNRGSDRGGNTAPILSLLQQLNSVNSLTEKDIVSDEGRFQLKDENAELRKQLTAEKELSAKLRAEFKRSKIAVPDQKQTGKAVTALMDAYLGKRMPKLHQSIMQDINQVFAEMRKPDGNWNLVDDLCKNVADKIVSNMEILHDEYWNQYSDLRSALHKTTLKLDETYWKDIVDFEDFRKAHFGTVKISKNNGMSVDSFYQELAETYPELFDASEYTNEVDQLYNIIDTIEGMKPYTEDYSAGEIGEFADTIAADVLQMSYDLNQKETFADKKYNEKIQAINKERVKANAKTREKLDRQKEMLTSKARAEKSAALAKEREKNLAKIEKIKEQNQEMLQRQKSRAKERLEKKDQFYRDKIKKVREQNKDRKDRKYYTSRIEAYSQWLSDSLLRPTDTRHIPENYRKAVAEMLESFDFSTDRTDAYTAKNGPSKRTLKLAALNQAYRELMDQESSVIEPDDEIAKLIEDLSVALEGKRFADLDTDQLAGVYRLVKNIRFAVSSVNKAFSDGLSERISDYGQKIINETASMKEKKQYGDMRQSISNFFNESNVTPSDAFLLMGDTMNKLYQNMRNGFNRHIDNTTQIKSFVEGLVKEYKVKKWIDKKAKPQAFELENGKSLELVPAQVMSLYCLMQREQAKNHILKSGVTSAPLPVSDGKVGKVTRGAAKRKLSQTQAMLTYNDTQNIIASLTAEQKKVADELQHFMSTVCADWGNETSMKLYGYKKFREKNYFPIKSSDIFLQESFDKMQPSKLKNVGFTKNTVVNAGNPIVLDDIFSVFSQHANTMSMYNALVPAITDFERVYNFKLKADGIDFASVKGNLKRAYGDQVNRYITNFMNDLNQNYAKNKDHEMAERLVANYKKAKIGFSLRVFLQQPTAVTRAAAVMNPKYFLNPSVWQSMIPGAGRKVRNEMFEHCQIARWKSWGFYNTDVSRDMREIFLDEKGIADEVFMGIYGKADDMTWGTIWKAVKKEIEHEHKDLEVGSDAYWDAVNERFSYVVDRTQVVDSVFHWSQIMRKKDLFSKITTSFMAEPTKTYNLLHTETILAQREAASGNKKAAAKRLSRICTVYLATALSTAMAAAVADALRGFGDDDKDKDYTERWADYTIANFKDMSNPLGLLPGYRDIASLFQGYDLDRTDMVGIKELIDSFAYWESETATKYYALKKTVAAISTVTGIPVGNVWREVESAAKTYKTMFEGQAEAAFFADKLRFDIKSDRNRSKFAYDYAMAEDQGDTAATKKIQKEVLTAGADQKKFESSVSTQAKNLAAKQAAQMVIDGNEKEARKIVQQCCNKYGGEYEKLWAKVEGEVAKRKTIFQKAYDTELMRLIRGER